MNAQVFGCPSCQQKFQVLPDQAGQLVQCPACAQTVEIPLAAFATATSSNLAPTLSAEPAPQIFCCQHCQGQFGVTAEMVGTQVGCPHCRRPVLIQNNPSPPALPDPSITITTAAGTNRGNTGKAFPSSVSASDQSTVPSKPATPRPSRSSGFQPPEVQRHPQARDSDLAPPPKNTNPKTADVAIPAREISTPPKTLSPGAPTSNKTDRNSETEVNSLSPSTTGISKNLNELEILSGPAQPASIDHLLPPKFDVEDPTRMRFSDPQGFKISLPDGDGGTKQIDQRILRVDHGGEKIALIALSPRQRLRRRIISNFIAIVIGIAVLALAFRLLI